jgi:formylglycine-generating enzyme required for sulfatase activity
MEIFLWDPVTGQEVRVMRKEVSGSDNEARLVWSADGSALIAYLDEGETAVVYDVASGEELLVSQDLPPYSDRIAYSPDNQLIAEGTPGGMIYLSEYPQLPQIPFPSSTPLSSATIAPYVTPTAMRTIGPGSVMLSLGDMRAVVFVPGGPFLMGASEGDANADPDEKPEHEVVLDPFWIDQTEVTHAEYDLCVQAGVCNPPNEVDSNGFSYAFAAAIQDAPVVNVSWDDAAAYCAWAGKRLPTEAEWEKAARGTDARLYPWGNDADAFHKAWYCDICIYDEHYPDVQDDFSRPVSVGSFPEGVSPFGAFDMAGNVWEWVSDWYASDAYSQHSPVNSGGPESGNLRGVRGGSWTTDSIYLRTTYRAARSPLSSWIDVGFRCAMVDERDKLTIQGEIP